ncbi:nucleotide sugar dehydrogenase [Bradyrhizobium sp.]|uniref:nucleotide sugar dehydrogenase n=1 Tax=Bradyrhizobium sp. TaxID=376 RepID=UPI0039C88E71
MRRRVGVVGLGYVGLPVAIAFGKAGALVLGFDIDRRRVEELRRYFDRTLEATEAELRAVDIRISADAADLREVDFFIVAVPTPIDATNRPDLSIILSASRTVGKALKKGDIVVYESTVYPGATEEEFIPLLESESGLKSGIDFHVGYSPERINPGDPQRRFETIMKVVSGQNPETLEIVAEVYGAVVNAGVYRASSIKVAEAAKVIENTQRDLNIALINELALIFNLLGIDTSDVLAAAATKWNFLKFAPGLVGGHCIGVDPYYLTHRAERAGYHPQVILAGRRVNDNMGSWIAQECVKDLFNRGNGKTVVILGTTFKENVPDIRNSKVIDIVTELRSFGVSVHIADPLADAAECQHEYGVTLTPFAELPPADAVILAVSHDEYKQGGWTLVKGRLKSTGGLVMDIKAILDRTNAPPNVRLWRM